MPRRLLISSVLLLTACGQSGALYLPEPPTPPVVTDPAPSGEPPSADQENDAEADAPPAPTPAPTSP